MEANKCEKKHLMKRFTFSYLLLLLGAIVSTRIQVLRLSYIIFCQYSMFQKEWEKKLNKPQYI